MFSCIKFEKARGKDFEKNFTPSKKYAELFLKIMEFIFREEKFKKLSKETKRFFNKKISEQKWKTFLKKHAKKYEQKWLKFNPSQKIWRTNENIEKLKKEWQTHMSKLSPLKILTIHIKGKCR